MYKWVYAVFKFSSARDQQEALPESVIVWEKGASLNIEFYNNAGVCHNYRFIKKDFTEQGWVCLTDKLQYRFDTDIDWLTYNKTIGMVTPEPEVQENVGVSERRIGGGSNRGGGGRRERKVYTDETI